MFKIPGWILAVIVFNIAVFLILLNPNPNVNLPFLSKPSTNVPNVNNETKTQVTNQSLNQSLNQTNVSAYQLNCINSISNYIKTIENITNFTTIETRIFNKSEDAIKYVKNWSSNYYELIGIGNDIYSLNKTNKTTVSVNDFKRKDGKNFTLPIICNENGTIKDYSSCILGNISNITLYCHNLTTSLSECDIEKMEYDFWQDISYWITPKPGPLNESQLFNFTIISSRNRLEYAFLNISYVRPPNINQNLFNKSQTTMKGDKISITTKLNLTGKIYGGLVLEASFKKKCYKYDLLSQYIYYGG